MIKLNLPVSSTSYNVTDADNVVSTKLDGGLSRYRQDVLGSVSTVKVTWVLGVEGYAYLRAFYRTATSNGSTPFLLDLIIDNATLEEHVVYFVPGKLTLTQQRGMVYTVSSVLEVKPLDRDTEYDTAVVMLYTEYGAEVASSFLDELEHLTNVQLPGSLH